MKKYSKLILEAIAAFVVSIVLLISIERYLLFYISWRYSLNYGNLLDKVTFAIFTGSLILFSILLISQFLYKKEVNYRFFFIIILGISSPLTRLWIHHNLYLSRVSCFQDDYLKCERDSIIGLLDKWGGTVVPCEYQFIYRFFDNEIGSERFASYNKGKDSENCYLYLYESGKQIGVENLQFSLESNVELFIQDNYGTLLEKWGGDSIHSTEFAYLDELRESREKAQKEILKAEKEFYILSELAGHVKKARFPFQKWEEGYERYYMEERFEEFRSNFKSYVESCEEQLEYAKRCSAKGKYESAIKAAKGCHTWYDYVLGEAQIGLDPSFLNNIILSISTKRASQNAITGVAQKVNLHHTPDESQEVVVKHQRQLQPVQEWVRCGSCQGTGKCPQCNGTGQNFYNSSNPYEACLTCGRNGRCPTCSGQRGHYETYYR